MNRITTEYHISPNETKSYIYIKKQNRDLSRYFDDYIAEDPLNEVALEKLIMKTEKVMAKTINICKKGIGNEIVIETENEDVKIIEAFAELLLTELEKFYEEHEVHVTRMFGSFIYLKREKGELKAIKATPVPIQYCPLMKQLLIEVGGEIAERLLSSLESGNTDSQSEMMCKLINEVVIKGGYFDTSRPLNSCEANVMFGASEIMSTAFRSGLIDAAVIVSNNLGTIITTNESNTQGAVKRMTGLFLTSPSRKIVEIARQAQIIPVFPHTASIDQLEGVKLAIALGYRKIAVSVAWKDNIILNEIRNFEKDGVIIYKFGLCSTGIDEKTAIVMENHADIIWSCASKMIRHHIKPNAIAQVGVKIPVYVMSEHGWLLVKNHLEVMGKDPNRKPISFDQVVCKKGKDKPIILNDINQFKIITADELLECLDCPHPCV